MNRDGLSSHHWDSERSVPAALWPPPSQRRLVPVPAGLDAAEAVAVVLNYITAYQMLYRSAKAQAVQSMLIHGASGGVVPRCCSCQSWQASRCTERTRCRVPHSSELGGIPIDYRNADFVKEIHRLTHDGVEPVFDGSAATKPGRISNSCRKRSMWLGSMFLAR